MSTTPGSRYDPEIGKALRWDAGDRTPVKVYITRVWNYGSMRDIHDMWSRFSPEEIREAVEHPLRGEWTKDGRALVGVVMNMTLHIDSLRPF